jgi:tellurite resistance protein TerC
MLFPFAEYWPFYLGFSGFVLAMLALDLGVFQRGKEDVPSLRAALLRSALWVGLALLFNVGLYFYVDSTLSGGGPVTAAATAQRVALEFLTGFLVEKALAVDNIFVFAVIFTYFGIARAHQSRILFYGVAGALVFRAVFIALGAYLMAYEGIVWMFGGLLIFTGAKMIAAPPTNADLSKSIITRVLRRVLPLHPGTPDGRFFVRENGRWLVTPMCVALLLVELSDILFAIDSIPAIFAITKEPWIVFTSNVFAILGLRSLSFLLAGAMGRFVYIHFGWAAVLVFVGVKMLWLNPLYGGKFPVLWSLGTITFLIGTSIAASFLATKRRAVDAPRRSSLR